VGVAGLAGHYWAAVRYTGGLQAAWDLAAWPSMTVPAGLHPSGTTVAAQLTAAAGGEPLLLGLGEQLEQVRPWTRHAPLSLATSG
jgi:amidase